MRVLRARSSTCEQRGNRFLSAGCEFDGGGATDAPGSASDADRQLNVVLHELEAVMAPSSPEAVNLRAYLRFLRSSVAARDGLLAYLLEKANETLLAFHFFMFNDNPRGQVYVEYDGAVWRKRVTAFQQFNIDNLLNNMPFWYGGLVERWVPGAAVTEEERAVGVLCAQIVLRDIALPLLEKKDWEETRSAILIASPPEVPVATVRGPQAAGAQQPSSNDVTQAGVSRPPGLVAPGTRGLQAPQAPLRVALPVAVAGSGSGARAINAADGRPPLTPPMLNGASGTRSGVPARAPDSARTSSAAPPLSIVTTRGQVPGSTVLAGAVQLPVAAPQPAQKRLFAEVGSARYKTAAYVMGFAIHSSINLVARGVLGRRGPAHVKMLEVLRSLDSSVGSVLHRASKQHRSAPGEALVRPRVRVLEFQTRLEHFLLCGPLSAERTVLEGRNHFNSVVADVLKSEGVMTAWRTLVEELRVSGGVSTTPHPPDAVKGSLAVLMKKYLFTREADHLKNAGLTCTDGSQSKLGNRAHLKTMAVAVMQAKSSGGSLKGDRKLTEGGSQGVRLVQAAARLGEAALDFDEDELMEDEGYSSGGSDV